MRALFIVAPLVVLLLVVLFISQRAEGPFYVSGFIEADEVRVGSRVGGRVQSVEVKEGEPVASGRRLVVLEPFDLLEREAQAAAELAASQAALTRLETGFRPEEIAQARARRDRLKVELDKLIAGPRALEIRILEDHLKLAEADLTNAQAEYGRVAELFERDRAGQNEMDDTVRLLDSARARHAAASDELALAREGTRVEDIEAGRAALAEAQEGLKLLESGSRAEDKAQAQAEVDALAATLSVIRAQIAELTVTAPQDGTIEALELQPGDLVGANAPMLTLILPRKLYLRAYLPENRLNVSLGQEVWVRVDSFPGRTFGGRISFVSRQGEFTPSNVQTPEERVKQVFRIKIELAEGLDVLRPGMSADVFFAPLE